MTLASKPVVRRLGNRLQHLYDWARVAGPFADIWDLCCDHGRLGLHLYQANDGADASTRCRVHLIDCVPGIIGDLNSRYEQWLGDYLSIDCCDAGAIALPPTGRQLIVVAGVGGGTIVDILDRLLSVALSPSSPPIDFMLSPNRNAFELRVFLRAHNFELLQEEFVSEKGWHHEHLHVRLHRRGGRFTKPALVGDFLWQPLTPEKVYYIKTQTDHYRRRVERGGHSDLQIAVNAYKGLLCQ